MGTRRYILRKVLQALLTLAFVMVFNFFLFRVIPSDSLELLLPGTTAINPTNVEQLTQDLGLDKNPCRSSSSSMRRTRSCSTSVTRSPSRVRT